MCSGLWLILKYKMNSIEFNSDDNFNFESIDVDRILKNNEIRDLNNVGFYKYNMLICGATGSGKTTYLFKLLLSNALNDNFKLYIVILPPESVNSGIWCKIIESKKLPIIPVVIGEQNLPTIDELQEVQHKVKGKICLILDDFIHSFNKSQWEMFNKYLIQTSRASCSVIALVQNVNFLKPAYKKNFNIFILFVNSLTDRQFNDIMRNYFDAVSFDKQQLKLLYSTFKPIRYIPICLFNNGRYDRCFLVGDSWMKFE